MPSKLLIVVSVLVLVLGILSFGLMLSLVRPWLQGLMAGAHVSAVELVAMRLRKSPVQRVMNCKIMAAQSGIQIPTSQIESAALAGADIETAVRTLMRATEMGLNVTWEQVIVEDNRRQIIEALDLSA